MCQIVCQARVDIYKKAPMHHLIGAMNYVFSHTQMYAH